jgi:phosphonopyruvate decarboxylase
MIEAKSFIDQLAEHGIDFYTGVPDSLLKDLCSYIAENCPSANQVIAANEGGAVGLAAGYHLATCKAALVYMQNSGTGNAVNPLLSLADPEVYAIPIFIVIGWRGEPGTKDEPQHKKQGRIQQSLLASLGYPYEVMTDDPGLLPAQIDRLAGQMKAASTPVLLLVRKGSFAEYAQRLPTASAYEMTREDALEIILGEVEPDARIISTTGMASREIYELREQAGDGHSKDFLTVGSMGHAVMIACGVALFRAGPVYCLDGDGAAIMHLGSLGITAAKGSVGFRHIVLNNGAHDSVGGQPTIGYSLPFYRVAKELGYRNSWRAETRAELARALQSMKAAAGPMFLEVRIRGGARKDLGRPTTSTLENKASFMDGL